ncbi:MAG TPA: acyl-CoA dehydrogenase family protein [Dehalococcoidales bacterium]|nr:acyl-CoA dehydrogenase family protein [Dehalococcoidales bacterium]
MKFQGVDYYQIDELLSEDEKMTRTLVREFLEKELEPLVVDAFHEEKPLDMRALAPKMGELGMIGACLPEKYGGNGANYVTFGLICQEVERVDSALRSYVAVQFGLVSYAIFRYGSEEQKQKWLPAIARGEKIGCFGLTEPNHGSDPGDMDTVAKKGTDGWVLSGTKQWITESAVADFAVVWAKTDAGVRGFIVERGTEGFSQTSQSRKGSMRASDVGELGFSDCRIPLENALPEVKGLSAPLSCLSQARYGISWGAIGMAMDCYETALNYAKEREQFGAPIAAYQLVQEKLVTMLIEITKAQLLSYRLGRLMDEGKANYTHISMAKKNNVSVARMCTRLARETLGANGISLDYSPIRHMANVESVYTYEGTDDMHTLILGQDITGIPAFRRQL